MHNAPSVSYPVGRSRMARRLLLAIWALGVAGFAAWCLQYSGAPWRSAGLALAVLLAGAAAWRAARLGDDGTQLHWDGQHWSCSGNDSLREAEAVVHLDFQTLLLVRLVAAEGRAAWLWLERPACPRRWLDLRRALYAQAPQPAATAASSQP